MPIIIIHREGCAKELLDLKLLDMRGQHTDDCCREPRMLAKAVHTTVLLGEVGIRRNLLQGCERFSDRY